MTPAEYAIAYIQQGWIVIPVRAREKRPVHDDWPHLRISVEEVPRYFKADSNIGVVLGDVSNGLVDVDLDCPEAIALAPHLLPQTAEFGRTSTPRAHWVYRSRGARTEQFRSLDRSMLVELRANKSSADGEGAQTVFPGSIHESGEAIVWEEDAGGSTIVEIPPEQLRLKVARLGAACALMRYAKWTLGRAAEFGKNPRAEDLRDVDAAVYERVARWLGFQARTQAPPPSPQRTPRQPPDNRLKRASAYLAKVPAAISGQGGHLNAWKAALAVVRGFDLTEGEAFSLLAREYNPRCEPPWSERELQHKVADAANNARIERGYLLNQERPERGYTNGAAHPISSSAAAAPAEPSDWEPPIEFDVFDLPAFPVDALPNPVAEFVRACAEATQTPVDLTAMLTLSAAAAACAKRALVEIKPGYREPLNLFTVVVLPPGERKSAVAKEVTAPILDWEKRAGERVAPEIARAAQRFELSKKRLAAATERAAKAKRREEREQLEMEVDELTTEHQKLTVPPEPRMLADDATPEALASLLAQYGGRMAILSAEGGVFTMMAGKYSETPSLDVYLKAHAGDEIRVDRKGRASERIADPALTLGLAVQPAVLEALADKPMLRGTGLLARFLYALPTSMLGARNVDAQPIPDSVRAGYAMAMRALLVLQDSPRPIPMKLTPEAYLSWRMFAEWIEPQLGEFGELDSIRDWASKLPGAVARISAILSILRILSINSQNQNISISIYVTQRDVEQAVQIGRYLVPHALAAFSAMGASELVQNAKALLSCLRRKAWTTFNRRDLHQSVKGSRRFADVEAVDAALALLVERHFIREAPQPPMNGPGRKPAPTYEVNPLWVAGEGAGRDSIPPSQNSQNSQNGASST